MSALVLFVPFVKEILLLKEIFFATLTEFKFIENIDGNYLVPQRPTPIVFFLQHFLPFFVAPVILAWSCEGL